MKLFIAAFLALATLQLSAQETPCKLTLTGQVLDQNTHEPVVGATLKIGDSDKIAYTDINGQFEFHSLCVGDYTLHISGLTIEPVQQSIQLTTSSKQDFFVHHHHETLEKVIVTGVKQTTASHTGQVQTLNTATIDEFSDASLGEALASLAGVAVLQTGKNIAKPVIQGFSGSRVPIYNHGIRQADQEWGSDHAPTVDLNSVGQLQVVKGASALAYGGDAIGGLIIAEAAKIPHRDSLYGKTILSGFSNGRGLSVSSELTKSFSNGWYTSAQAAYKKAGDYKAPDYYLSNTGLENRSFSLRLGLQKFHYGFDAYFSNYNSNLGILRASSTGSISDLVTAINQDKPVYSSDFSYQIASPRQKVNHQLFRLKAYYHFDQLGKLNLTYGYQNNQRYEYDIRRGDFKYKPAIDLLLKTHSLTAEFNFNTRQIYALKAGINAEHKDNTAAPDTGIQRIIPDYKSDALGAYLIGHYRPNENWLIEAGLRYDYSRIDAYKYYSKYRWEAQNYQSDFSDLIIGEHGSQWLTHPQFTYHNISATLGGRYQLSSALDLRLNYALSNRAPNPAELFSDGLHHSAASIELGDLRLQPENAHKIGLSLEKSVGKWQFTLSPYFNYIANFIYLKPDGFEETIRGVFLRYQYTQNDAQMWGVDAQMLYQFAQHWQYETKFSTITGQHTQLNRPLVAMPTTKWFNGLQYSRPDWHQLQLSVQTEINFEKQDYPDDNFTIRLLDNGVYRDALVDISTPPETYFLAHFKASAVFHPLKNTAWKVNFSIDNIFNTAYRNYLNRLRYYADNLGRNFSLQLIISY